MPSSSSTCRCGSRGRTCTRSPACAAAYWPGISSRAAAAAVRGPDPQAERGPQVVAGVHVLAHGVDAVEGDFHGAGAPNAGARERPPKAGRNSTPGARGEQGGADSGRIRQKCAGKFRGRVRGRVPIPRGAARADRRSARPPRLSGRTARTDRRPVRQRGVQAAPRARPGRSARPARASSRAGRGVVRDDHHIRAPPGRPAPRPRCPGRRPGRGRGRRRVGGGVREPALGPRQRLQRDDQGPAASGRFSWRALVHVASPPLSALCRRQGGRDRSRERGVRCSRQTGGLGRHLSGPGAQARARS